VVQIWPGQTVTCLHTNSPGHIWTTLYTDINICTYTHPHWKLMHQLYSWVWLRAGISREVCKLQTLHNTHVSSKNCNLRFIVWTAVYVIRYDYFCYENLQNRVHKLQHSFFLKMLLNNAVFTFRRHLACRLKTREGWLGEISFKDWGKIGRGLCQDNITIFIWNYAGNTRTKDMRHS
jgi:hypothetical protein